MTVIDWLLFTTYPGAAPPGFGETGNQPSRWNRLRGRPNRLWHENAHPHT